MSIVSYIENLRSKPEHVRHKASFWWAFGITAVIFIFWLASFEFTGSAVKTSAASVAQKVSSPGQSMVAAVGDLANNIWTSLTGPKKVIYSEVQVVPGKN